MFQLILLGINFPSSSPQPLLTSTLTSYDDDKKKNSNKEKVRLMTKLVTNPLAQRLIIHFQLFNYSTLYSSAYLFARKITLFEILCQIFRHCLEQGRDYNVEEDVKKDREIIHEQLLAIQTNYPLYENLVNVSPLIQLVNEEIKNNKITPNHDNKTFIDAVIIRHKMATHRRILERIRALDISGQMFQSMNLLHLWVC